MKRNSWPVLVSGFVFSITINIALFALIPHFARVDLPRELPFRRQTIHFFKELPPPEQVQKSEEIVEKETPPPVPQPQPAPLSLPQMIQEPALNHSALPQPTLTMTTGFNQAPLTGLSDFYSPEVLDRKPQLSYQAPPLYPYRAKRMNTSGFVRIRFDVGADGRVSNIHVLDSQPAGVFDDAVMTAVKKWKFHPGELMGDKVVTRMTRKIVFNLEE